MRAVSPLPPARFQNHFERRGLIFLPAGDRSARGGLFAWAKALHIQPIYGAFVGRIETSPIGVCLLTLEVLGVPWACIL